MPIAIQDAFSKGIRGYVEVVKMREDGVILETKRFNTINNSLKDLFAKLLYYGSADTTHVPSFKIARMKLGNGASDCQPDPAQATSLCHPFGLVTGQNDVTLISPDYMYINSGQLVNTAEVRYGIVIPVNYPFIVDGVQQVDYNISEAGLFAYIGGEAPENETMIAWTSFNPAVSKTAADIIALSWVIQLS